MTIKFSMETAHPIDGQAKAAMSTMLMNMRSLRIIADGREHGGTATINSVDGHLVIEVGKKAKASKLRRVA